MGKWLEGRLLCRSERVEEGRKVLEAALEEAKKTDILWLAEDLQMELSSL